MSFLVSRWMSEALPFDRSCPFMERGHAETDLRVQLIFTRGGKLFFCRHSANRRRCFGGEIGHRAPVPQARKRCFAVGARRSRWMMRDCLSVESGLVTNIVLPGGDERDAVTGRHHLK